MTNYLDSLPARNTTLPQVKKALAASFPDIEFTYDRSGRGRDVGHRVCWTGGPQEDVIRAAANLGYRSTVRHFARLLTPEETEIWCAEERARWAAEAAARPALKAAAKAAGIVKRQIAQDRKRDIKQVLSEKFPAVTFAISLKDDFLRASWTGGPTVKTVSALLDIREWACTRTPTATEIADGDAAEQAQFDDDYLAGKLRRHNPATLSEAGRARATELRTQRRYRVSVARRGLAERAQARKIANTNYINNIVPGQFSFFDLW